MIIDLINRMFKSTLYVRIRRNKISVRFVEKKREVTDQPIVGMNGKNRILAVGEEANSHKYKNIHDYRVLNGFDHPRTIIGQFDIADAALRYLMKRTVSSRAFVRPVIVFHPKDDYEGGLSQIEVRALRDMGEHVGGREVHIWVGRDLTDEELQSGKFPEYEGQLI